MEPSGSNSWSCLCCWADFNSVLRLGLAPMRVPVALLAFGDTTVWVSNGHLSWQDVTRQCGSRYDPVEPRLWRGGSIDAEPLSDKRSAEAAHRFRQKTAARRKFPTCAMWAWVRPRGLDPIKRGDVEIASFR